MVGQGGGRLAAWVLSVGLLLPAGVQAGSPMGCANDQAPACPPHEYSCLHYWIPALYRIRAHCHGPRVDLCAPDRYPEIPLGCRITKFPCQAVAPAPFYSDTSLPR